RRGKARRALRAGRADRRARRPGGRCSRSRAAATPRGTPVCALSRRRGARRAGTRAACALIELPIQRLREDAVVPARAYSGDAGLDLSACERVELGPRVRVSAILGWNGRVLLCRHEKPGKEYWLLPGGGVNGGESLVDALHRELAEEIGIDDRLPVEGPVAIVDSIGPQSSFVPKHVV